MTKSKDRFYQDIFVKQVHYGLIIIPKLQHLTLLIGWVSSLLLVLSEKVGELYGHTLSHASFCSVQCVLQNKPVGRSCKVSNMSCTVWKRMMCQLMNITFCSCHHFSGAKWFGADWSVHQRSANGQTNDKSENSREGTPKNTESARKTSWFMLIWAINLCNSVRKTALPSEYTQVFLKFRRSNETIISGFGLCLAVNIFSGKMHFTALHNTNLPTSAWVLWGWERPCRQLQMRITISSCPTPCFILPLKQWERRVFCCQTEFNYS